MSYTQYSGKPREVKCMSQADLLQDKVILVTGGGTGLGRAMGERFLELGAKLAICGRRQEVAEQAAADMARRSGGETFATRCDVRQAEQVEAMMNAVIERFGRIDVLVNNAAGNFISPTERLSPLRSTRCWVSSYMAPSTARWPWGNAGFSKGNPPRCSILSRPTPGPGQAMSCLRPPPRPGS